MGTRRPRREWWLGVLLGLLFLLPAVWLGWQHGRLSSPPAPKESPDRGDDPTRPLQLVSPAGWRLERERGRTEPYHQIRLVGARNAEDTYTAFISIRVRPLREAGGFYAHVGELVRHSIDRRLEGARVEGPRAVRVAGVPAEELIVVYTIPALRHHAGAKPADIPVTTRSMFFERGSSCYELVYSADTREYARHEAVFTRLLESLRVP
ncbi:MAG: hypothetical protein HY599_05470 [Candidatus Omnitrophica bacterium]|nr:hypothetical protein [Candidatus Omnitrophota bacterium]